MGAEPPPASRGARSHAPEQDVQTPWSTLRAAAETLINLHLGSKTGLAHVSLCRAKHTHEPFRSPGMGQSVGSRFEAFLKPEARPAPLPDLAASLRCAGSDRCTGQELRCHRTPQRQCRLSFLSDRVPKLRTLYPPARFPSPSDSWEPNQSPCPLSLVNYRTGGGSSTSNGDHVSR